MLDQATAQIPSAAETAAAVIAQASETARNVVSQASETAKNVLANEATITKALSDALREVFGENTASGRFIDITRIPLICKSVIDTNEKVKETNDSIKEINNKLDNKYVTAEAFKPVRNVVYGLVSLILTAVIIALLMLVIRK